MKSGYFRFYSEVSSPVQGVCRMLKRFGGQWMAKWKVGLVWFGLMCYTLDMLAKWNGT